MPKTLSKLLKGNWTNPELDSLGFELLEWLDTDKDNNFLLLEFFNLKEIPMEWVNDWNSDKTKYSAAFKRCYRLALQVQEQRLAKKVISKSYATAGLIAVLKNLCGWTSDSPENSIEVNITPDNLEKIKNKYFRKANVKINEDDAPAA